MSHSQVIRKKCVFVAKVSTKEVKCLFCGRDTNDEITYGKLYDIGDVSCHYFCALLSCYLIQKGKDEEGLFGFLYKDIIAEADRGKKYKCSYCSLGGATLGCSMPQCRKQFHLPCGRERNAVSLFHQNFRSFCEKHAPKQKIPPGILAKANERRRNESSKKRKNISRGHTDKQNDSEEVFCVICYEAVPGYPSVNTFWPSCCGKDAWFHRSCLQRMALSSGMHYLKCPLCNDKDDFYMAVLNQGYYVPDRDAAWELEQNAFAEIYERPNSCSAVECKCYMGRDHDAETGSWDLKLCLLCGSSCAHLGCMPDAMQHFVCALCNTVAPPDLDALHKLAVSVAEAQAQLERSPRRGPVVGSRMSLRRTKQLPPKKSSSANQLSNPQIIEPIAPQPSGSDLESTNTTRSRQQLNLSTPKRNATPTVTEEVRLKDLTNVFSPMKMVEASLRDKIMGMDVKEMSVVDTKNLIEKVREQFRKPRPLSWKRRIVSDILEDIMNKSSINPKQKSEILSGEVTLQTYVIDSDIKTKVSNEIIEEDIVDVVTINNDLSTNNDAITVPQVNNDLTEIISGQDVKENDSVIEEDNVDVVTNNDLSSSNDAITVPQVNNDLTEIISGQDVKENDSVIEEDNVDVVTNNDLSSSNDAITVPQVNNDLTEIISGQDVKENDSVIEEDNVDVVTNNDLSSSNDAITVPQVNNDFTEIISDQDVKENDSVTSQVNDLDDTSKSTFELPSEFIADVHSDGSLNSFETPKKRKSVNLEKDSSLEISEENQTISVDVVKMDTKVKLKDKCSYKFSPIDKETLQDKNLDIDLELFKNRYLTEVDKNTYKCAFNHKHDETSKNDMMIQSVIDFAIDAAVKKAECTENGNLKRKSSLKRTDLTKKKKIDEVINLTDEDEHTVDKNLILDSSDGTEAVDGRKKIDLTPIKLIFREQSKSMSPDDNRVYKQTVLSFVSKSDFSSSPGQRAAKKGKRPKNKDNLKQTSIVKFFSSKNG